MRERLSRALMSRKNTSEILQSLRVLRSLLISLLTEGTQSAPVRRMIGLAGASFPRRMAECTDVWAARHLVIQRLVEKTFLQSLSDHLGQP